MAIDLSYNNNESFEPHTLCIELPLIIISWYFSVVYRLNADYYEIYQSFSLLDLVFTHFHDSSISFATLFIFLYTFNLNHFSCSNLSRQKKFQIMFNVKPHHRDDVVVLAIIISRFKYFFCLFPFFPFLAIFIQKLYFLVFVRFICHVRSRAAQ